MAHDLEERASVGIGDTARAVRKGTWWTHWEGLTGWYRARSRWAGLVVATIAISVGLRLWALDVLPGEIYGDIAIVWDYLLQVREGRWPFHYVLSFGPLFPYLAAPVVWVTGMTYWGLKLTSVVVSLWMLGAVYLLGRELLNRELGLLSAFIAGTSSWLLIFSRIGHQIIVVPLLTTLALALVARTVRTGQTWPIAASAVTAALGLYVYAASFVLPLAVAATLLVLWGTCRAIRLRHFLLFTLVTLVASVPFARLVARDPQNFLGGYIGGKFAGNADPLGALLHNLWLSLLALHVRGDVVFRSNPSGLPHLDHVSGLLFLAGLVFWLRSERRALSPLLLVPFTLLQVPAMLSINSPGEVPSASRTLAIAPLAAVLVASGVRWGWELFRSRPALVRWAPPALGIVLVAILALNIERYFVRYADGLPDHNTPFGRIIATWADSLPPGTQVYVAGCCWGAWAQPEVKGILYAMARPERFHHVELKRVNCDWVATLTPPAAIVWRPDLELPTPDVRPCLSGVNAAIHTSPRGQPVFRAIWLPPGWQPPTVALDTAPLRLQTEAGLRTLDGSE